MAGVVKNLMVRAGADFSAITKQSKIASDSMKKMSTSISGSAGIIKKALGAITAAASITAIVAAAKDAKEAYDKQAEAEARLAQVMRNTMQASAAEVKQIKELCSAQQALGVVGDEVQLAGAQELATYLSTTDALKQLIPVMNDMAVQQYGYKVSAEEATNIATMMGKVMEGQTGALSRYGYYFTEAEEQILKFGTEAERAATLAKIVESSVGGMNQALAQTPTGRLQQLSNTLGDIKEQFGKAVTTVLTAFLPALNAVASLLASIANVATRAAQAIANVFGKKLSMGTAVATAGAGNAAEALEEVADSATNAGEATKKARKELQTLSFDTMIVMKDTSDDSSDSSGVSGKIKSAAEGANAPLVENLFDTDEAEESLGWLEKVLKKIKDLIDSLDFEPLKKAWKKLGDAAKNLGSVITKYLGSVYDKVLVPLAHWTVEKALPASIELVASAVQLLADVLNAVKPAFDWLLDNILAPLAAWAGDVFIKALTYIREKLQALSDLITGKISFKEFLENLTPLEKILGAIAVAVGTVGAVFDGIYGAVYAAVLAFSAVSKVISAVGTAISLLTSPIGIAVIVIAGLVFVITELYLHWDEVVAAINTGIAYIQENFTWLYDGVSLVIDGLKTIFQGICDFVTGVFTGNWSLAWQGVQEIFDGFKDYIIGVNGVLLGWLDENVIARLQALADNIGTILGGIVDFLAGVFTGDWERAWNGVVEIFRGVVGTVQTIIDGIISVIQTLIDWCKSAIGWLRSLGDHRAAASSGGTGGLGVSGGSGGTTVSSSGFSGTSGKFASGGFPDVGQLFLARESGPEMVGTIGGRTAVANNSDIVAAIEGGVYNAMVSAMTASGGSRSGGGASLYINGREFMRAIWEDRNAVIAEHGVSLITNG